MRVVVEGEDAGDEAGTCGTAGKSADVVKRFIGWGTRGECLRRCGSIDRWSSRLTSRKSGPE